MVAIPVIKDSFLHACRYRSDLMEERGLSVVCFPRGVGIERLHVHGPPWFPTLLLAYDHPVAVCHWVVNGDWLDHTESDMSVSSVLPEHESCGHEWLITSPTVGNLVVIMPIEIHASRLRNSLSELSVMYVICLVSRGSPYGDLPANRRMAAPRMLIPLPLAACIFIETGSKIKSSAVIPKRGRSFIPPRQLWHPMSAIDDRMLDLVLDFRGNPRSA